MLLFAAHFARNAAANSCPYAAARHGIELAGIREANQMGVKVGILVFSYGFFFRTRRRVFLPIPKRDQIKVFA